MIDGGLTFPWLVSLLRMIYVEVAEAEFGIDGKPPTQSRVAVLTGVHRKEIKRLTTNDRADNAAPANLSLSARVIAVWCSDPDYLDDDGHPLPLPRTAAYGKPSLERLVAAVSQDVRARSLLEEWLRLGVVDLEGDQVRLQQAGLVPSKGYEEKAYYFGRNIRDHIAAGAHNLESLEPAFLDRAVSYSGLSRQSLDELQALCKQRGEALLLEINRQARQLAERDGAAGQPDGRMIFGAYFFAEDQPMSAEAGASDAG
jgi:hypothetical protein